MRVHLVDGTYELFRAYYGAPSARTPDGVEVGATLGLLRSLVALIQRERVTHLACAFDHVIESFRNLLFAGYKTGDGVAPELLSQFPLAERAVRALGIVAWPMVEFEADDALATAAARFAAQPGVEEIVICTPDKDLAQCVRGVRVVCLDRRRGTRLTEDGVRARFGVGPAGVPDWLALVGDDADGIPGVPRWGEKSASLVLGRWERLEAIPEQARRWEVAVRGAEALARSLLEHRAPARLWRTLATLREDAPLEEDLEALRWRGPDREALAAFCAEMGSPDLIGRLPA